MGILKNTQQIFDLGYDEDREVYRWIAENYAGVSKVPRETKLKPSRARALLSKFWKPKSVTTSIAYPKTHIGGSSPVLTVDGLKDGDIEHPIIGQWPKKYKWRVNIRQVVPKEHVKTSSEDFKLEIQIWLNDLAGFLQNGILWADDTKESDRFTHGKDSQWTHEMHWRENKKTPGWEARVTVQHREFSFLEETDWRKIWSWRYTKKYLIQQRTSRRGCKNVVLFKLGSFNGNDLTGQALGYALDYSREKKAADFIVPLLPRYVHGYVLKGSWRDIGKTAKGKRLKTNTASTQAGQ